VSAHLVKPFVGDGDVLRLEQDACLLGGLRPAAGLEENLQGLGIGAWARKASGHNISKSVPES